jgi:hypothetical protein
MTLKPQDIVVLLKLLKAGDKRPTYAQLAVDLYMSPSEVHASIRRARTARLIHGPELGDRVNAKALEEFLVHGIRYAFPPEKGGMIRGMPTASAAEPLSRKMTQEEPVPVWPFEQGSKRGYAFLPLYKKAPQAALKDHELYQLLAPVDALRDRSANWRNVSSPLGLRIELSIQSTAAGGDGGKAEAIAAGNRLCGRLHDGSANHRSRRFSGARNRRC